MFCTGIVDVCEHSVPVETAFIVRYFLGHMRRPQRFLQEGFLIFLKGEKTGIYVHQCIAIQLKMSFNSHWCPGMDF